MLSGSTFTVRAMLPPLFLPIGTPKRDREPVNKRVVLRECLQREGPLIRELERELNSSEEASSVFRAYCACCLYADGFDFLINFPSKLEELDYDLDEFLEINEVSDRAIHAARIMNGASTPSELKNVELVIKGVTSAGVDHSELEVSELLTLAASVRKDLEFAFDILGDKLTEELVVFSGEDRADEEDEDGEELEGVASFEWSTPFVSTSTDLSIARRFSNSQMGMSVNGIVWKLTVQPGVVVLPLTASVGSGSLIDSRWVGNPSIIEESEVLLSRDSEANVAVSVA